MVQPDSVSWAPLKGLCHHTPWTHHSW